MATTFKRFFCSSIGMKFLMSLSGLVMVGFLVAHLSGNLLVFLGPDALNTYAAKLRDYLPVLWFLRLGLLASVILHIILAVKLTRQNREAKSISYHNQQNQKASKASRTMMLTGSVILSFILFHLAHLTFRLTHPEFAALPPFEVYEMIVISFQNPWISLFYILSVSLLMMHLCHGIRSVFQTLGLYHTSYVRIIECGSFGLSMVLGLGFLSIPVAVFFGFIGL